MLGNRRTAVLTAVAASAGLVLASALTQSTAVAAPSGHKAVVAHVGTEKVIVVLRDQLASTPVRRSDMDARKSLAKASQNDVLDSLAGPDAKDVTHLTVGNAFVATVTTDQAAALAADPSVASVVKDSSIAVSPPTSSQPATGGSAPAPSSGPNVYDNDPTKICPTDPAKPLLEPEALQSIRARPPTVPERAAVGTGSGVKVAFIADSIDSTTPTSSGPTASTSSSTTRTSPARAERTVRWGRGIRRRLAIAAQGTVTYDLSQFVNQAHPLPAGCNISVVGVAPERARGHQGGGIPHELLDPAGDRLRGEHRHVDVLNESFGLNSYPDNSSRNTMTLFNDAAVAAGVTVTVSSGDAGITSTIGSPPGPEGHPGGGHDRQPALRADDVRRAGFFANGRWVERQHLGAVVLRHQQFRPHRRRRRTGRRQLGRLPDPMYSGCLNFRSPAQPTDLSPSAEPASPRRSRPASPRWSSRPTASHNGASPTPAVVKQIITGTAHDLGLPADEQGADCSNARAATEAAMTWPGLGGRPGGREVEPRHQGRPDDPGRQAGLTQRRKVTVTNVGTKPLTVPRARAGTRPLSASQQTVPFDSRTLPTFIYYNGETWAFKKVTFNVPAGAQRLFERMAFQGTGPLDIIRMTLLDPSGTIRGQQPAAGRPGHANYANVDVRNPTPGQWTAVLVLRGRPAGYHGPPVIVRTDTQRATPVGSVSPATFTLAPGKSRTVTRRSGCRAKQSATPTTP